MHKGNTVASQIRRQHGANLRPKAGPGAGKWPPLGSYFQVLKGSKFLYEYIMYLVPYIFHIT